MWFIAFQMPAIADIIEDENDEEFSDCSDEVWNNLRSKCVFIFYFVQIFEPENSKPSSQTVASQSSSYIPSSQSTENSCSETLEDSFIDGNAFEAMILIFFYIIILESEDFSQATVIVMWVSLLELLCKCTHPGCGASVLPDNMRPVRNGMY